MEWVIPSSCSRGVAPLQNDDGGGSKRLLYTAEERVHQSKGTKGYLAIEHLLMRCLISPSQLADAELKSARCASVGRGRRGRGIGMVRRPDDKAETACGGATLPRSLSRGSTTDPFWSKEASERRWARWSARFRRVVGGLRCTVGQSRRGKWRHGMSKEDQTTEYEDRLQMLHDSIDSHAGPEYQCFNVYSSPPPSPL